jgi:cell division protein FtsB
MTKIAARQAVKKVTIRKLHDELQRLRRRVQDLEDLRDLNAAIARNGGKAGIPWDQVKKEIGL